MEGGDGDESFRSEPASTPTKTDTPNSRPKSLTKRSFSFKLPFRDRDDKKMSREAAERKLAHLEEAVSRTDSERNDLATALQQLMVDNDVLRGTQEEYVGLLQTAQQDAQSATQEKEMMAEQLRAMKTTLDRSLSRRGSRTDALVQIDSSARDEKVKHLSQAIKTAEAEKEDFAKLLQELVIENDRLKTQLGELETTKTAANKRIEELEKLSAARLNTIEEYKRELHDRDMDVQRKESTYGKSIQNTMGEKRELSQKLSLKQEECDRLQDRCVKLEEQLAELTAELGRKSKFPNSTLSEEARPSASILESALQEKNAAEKQVNRLTADVKSLNMELHDALQEKSNRSDQLKRSNDQLHRCRMEVVELKRTMHDLSRKNTDLEGEVKSLSASQMEVRSEHESMKQRLAAAKQQEDRAVSIATKLGLEKEEISQQLIGSRRERDDLLKRLTEARHRESPVSFRDYDRQFDEEREHLRREIESAREELCEAQNKLTETEESRTAAVDERERAYAGLVGASEEIDRLQKELREFQIKEKTGDVSQSHDMLRLQEKESYMQNQIDDLKSNLEGVKGELLVAQQDKEALTRKMAKLTSEVQVQSERVVHHKKIAESLDAERSRLEKALDHITQTKRISDADSENALAEREALRSQIADDLAKRNKEAGRLEAEVAQWKAAYGDVVDSRKLMAEEIDGLRESLDIEIAEREKQGDGVKALEEQLERTISEFAIEMEEAATKGSELTAALSETKEQLRKAEEALEKRDSEWESRLTELRMEREMERQQFLESNASTNESVASIQGDMAALETTKNQEIERLQRALESMKEEKVHLSQRLSDASDRVLEVNREASEKLDSVAGRENELLHQLRGVRDTNRDLEKDITLLEESKAAVERRLDEVTRSKEKAIDDLRKDVYEREISMEKEKVKISSLEKEIVRLEVQAAEQSRTLKKLEEAESQRKAAEREALDLHRKVIDLETSLAKATSNAQIAKQDLEKRTADWEKKELDYQQTLLQLAREKKDVEEKMTHIIRQDQIGQIYDDDLSRQSRELVQEMTEMMLTPSNSKSKDAT